MVASIAALLLGSFDRNRVVLRLDGTWMLPIYFAVRSTSEQHSAMEITQDRGMTWKQYDCIQSNYLVQPSVIRAKLGEPHLRAFFRDRRSQHIYRADSEDDGQLWTIPIKTILPNNNAAIEATILYYTSNATVIVFNNQTKGRNALEIALSYDEGVSWPYQRYLEHSDENMEYSYPTVLQTPDGDIHVSYTYNLVTVSTVKYVVVNENWIKNL